MHSPRLRGVARAAALAAAALCGALFAQAVNLKPGKYEFVSTSQVTLPPAMARQVPPGFLARVQQPRTHQTCISDVNLAQVSKQLSQERQADPSCKMTAHTLSGNKVKFDMQCQHASSHFDGSFASDSFKAVLVLTTDKGQKETVNLSGRRIGDCDK
jgi:uncharacterized protein DUF3617